jgi:predicted metal-dependent hydrolase
MNLTYILSGILILLIIFLIVNNYRKNINYVISSSDNQKYLVYDLKYKELAANTLAYVRNNLQKLCDVLEKKYPKDERVIRMVSKFDPEAIVENDPESKNTSYSINKGEKIVLCLRSKDGQNRIVKKNVIMFVALHEMAHIMTLSVGHTKEFWDNFEFLLREASKIGIYEEIDFNSSPHSYCGVRITDTPTNR